jgi:hypothetical protein
MAAAFARAVSSFEGVLEPVKLLQKLVRQCEPVTVRNVVRHCVAINEPSVADHAEAHSIERRLLGRGLPIAGVVFGVLYRFHFSGRLDRFDQSPARPWSGKGDRGKAADGDAQQAERCVPQKFALGAQDVSPGDYKVRSRTIHLLLERLD